MATYWSKGGRTGECMRLVDGMACGEKSEQIVGNLDLCAEHAAERLVDEQRPGWVTTTFDFGKANFRWDRGRDSEVAS